MASKGDTQINTFVGGLITEASPLSFPENASFDEINFKLKKDGTRERRLGIDYEDNAASTESGLTALQMPVANQRFFRWETPGGSANVEIGIIQIGNILWFIDLFSSAPSTALLNSGNSLVMGIESISSVYDFTVVNNDVILVSHLLTSPYILVYDEDTDVVSASTSDIKIRDLYGVDDGFGDDQRPTSLTASHEYNLRNQGWSANITTTCSSISDALACTNDVIGKYPSNSDTWSLGKIEDVASADVDKYDPDTLVKNSVDLGLAAKGHYIIDAYNRGTSRENESQIDLPLVDRELGRISTVATYAGRAFYSGIQSRLLAGDKFSPKNAGTVFFSQVVRNIDDFVKCYQAADPTSAEFSDIVDTDGGVLPVLGASNIIKLITVKQSLFVFAQNGVWEIKGDDLGFKATGFQINRLTTVGVLSRDSIVETNGSVLYWANEGIFSLAPDQFGTSWDVTNLTLATIQTIYNSIPTLLKNSVRGWYDQANNQVRWLFQSDSPKVVGNPIDIELDLSPFEVGECTTVPFTFPPVDIDNRVLTDTDYVIVSVTSEGGGVQEIYGIVATNSNSVGVSFGAEYLIDDTISSYRFLSVAKLTSELIMIAAIDITNKKLYAISCSVIGGVITKLKNQLIGSINTVVPAVSIVQVDSTRALIIYNGTGNVQGVVVESAGATINVGTSVQVSLATSYGKLDVSRSPTSELFYVMGRTTDGIDYGQIPVSVSGLVVTQIADLADAGMYGGTNYIPNALLSPNHYVVLANNVLVGSSLATLPVGSTGQTDIINTTDTAFHVFADVVVSGDKIVVVYAANPSSGDPYLEMEVFSESLGILASTNVVRLCDLTADLVRMSNEGFTDTRYPVTFREFNISPTLARTLVFEGGTI